MRQPVDDSCDVLLAYPRERMHVFESMIPLGLASVGAVLEQRGYRVRIVDFAFYARDFRRDLRRWNPRVVGIGGTTATRAGSFLTACLVKEVMPHVPVVYGGVHASFAAEDTLSNVPQIDYVVCGEGEFAFAGLCDRLIRGEGPDPSETAGVSLRSETGYVHNKPQRIDDLDALPLPARHLFGDHYRMTLDFLGTPAEFLIRGHVGTERCLSIWTNGAPSLLTIIVLRHQNPCIRLPESGHGMLRSRAMNSASSRTTSSSSTSRIFSPCPRAASGAEALSSTSNVRAAGTVEQYSESISMFLVLIESAPPFGITRQAVYQLRKRLGIDSMIAGNDERNQEIIARYKSGKTGTAIAGKIDLSTKPPEAERPESRRQRSEASQNPDTLVTGAKHGSTGSPQVYARNGLP